MPSTPDKTAPAITRSQLWSKVPEITAYFWIIKVLCTTVGETAADFLNVNLNFGLLGTSVVTGVLLAVALVFQFRARTYRPAIYWLTVALVSVFGTLVTDILTDSLGVPLEVTTLVFGALLAGTFLWWYRQENTLSIHSIVTRRRESFYWLAILVTFALGTAAGDLMAQGLGLGYVPTGMIVLSLVALTAIGWKIGLNSVLAFWMIYILTRPLGASIGDYLSQSVSEGGLGLGATMTSVVFAVAILAAVAFLSITKADVISEPSPAAASGTTIVSTDRGGLRQTVAVVCVLLLVGVSGYYVRRSALESASTQGSSTAGADTTASPLGDLSAIRTIAQDTLSRLDAGDQSGATTRIADLESEWDASQARLQAKNAAAWTTVDGKIDTVLRALRSTSPDLPQEKAALTDLLTELA